jgi:predicted SAM-dependent methyltransferase
MQQQSTAISLHTPLSEIDYAFYMKVLHVGSGPKLDKLHPYFREHSWVETRLDIDPECKPDIVASITDMPAVTSQSIDAVYSSHNLEHLHAHEVTLAVREFLRVLKPRGFALIALPDLQSVAQLVVERGLNATAYVSSAGPVAPIDMIYGHRAAIAHGMHFMAHRTGFTAQTLSDVLIGAGFKHVATARVPPPHCDLWALAFAFRPEHSHLVEMAGALFPK